MTVVRLLPRVNASNVLEIGTDKACNNTLLAHMLNCCTETVNLGMCGWAMPTKMFSSGVQEERMFKR